MGSGGAGYIRWTCADVRQSTHEGVVIPLPNKKVRARLKQEAMRWHPDRPQGTVTARFHTRVRAWAGKLRRKFQDVGRFCAPVGATPIVLTGGRADGTHGAHYGGRGAAFLLPTGRQKPAHVEQPSECTTKQAS